MFQVKFPASFLRAAWLFVKKDDKGGSTLRHEYEHVILDRTLVATDGHTVIVFNPAKVDISGDGVRPVLIPRSLLEALGELQGDVTLYIDPAAGKGVAHTGYTFELARGSVVDWRRVYPRQLSGEHAQYNLAYLDRCVRANVILGPADAYDYHAGAALEIQPNGQNGPGVVTLRDDIAHVVIQYMYTRNHSKPFDRFNL